MNKITLKYYLQNKIIRLYFNIFIISLLLLVSIFVTVTYYLDYRYLDVNSSVLVRLIKEYIAIGDWDLVSRTLSTYTKHYSLDYINVVVGDESIYSNSEKSLYSVCRNSHFQEIVVTNCKPFFRDETLARLCLLLLIFISAFGVVLYTFLNTANDFYLKTQSFIEGLGDKSLRIGEIVEFDEITDRYDELIKENNINEKKQARFEITRQIAHDIRSPLTALEVVMADIQTLPEEYRDITTHAINRIQEIASELLNEGCSNNTLDLTLPVLALEDVIREKKIEYQYANLEIETIYLSVNKLSRINVSYFKRILSNILNNSIEAVNQNGHIIISILSQSTNIIIIIEDNGKGFPQKVLKGGITKGLSIGKDQGNGLGLSFASNEIKKINGELFLSNTDFGAKVEIKLPIIPENGPFVTELNICDFLEILIIDDDLSIHDVWKRKFKKIDKRIVHILREGDLDQVAFNRSQLILIDQDLRMSMSGLEIISKHRLKNSVLVTSHYNDLEIQSKCRAQGIGLIPKSYVHFLEIKE